MTDNDKVAKHLQITSLIPNKTSLIAIVTVMMIVSAHMVLPAAAISGWDLIQPWKWVEWAVKGIGYLFLGIGLGIKAIAIFLYDNPSIIVGIAVALYCLSDTEDCIKKLTDMCTNNPHCNQKSSMSSYLSSPEVEDVRNYVNSNEELRQEISKINNLLTSKEKESVLRSLTTNMELDPEILKKITNKVDLSSGELAKLSERVVNSFDKSATDVVTVKIIKIEELESPDQDENIFQGSSFDSPTIENDGHGDYFSHVKIGDKTSKIKKDNHISGEHIEPNWHFTEFVNSKKYSGKIPIEIILFDYDKYSVNERMDISPKGDNIDIDFDIKTQKWTGDISFSKWSKGDGKNSAKVKFEISSKPLVTELKPFSQYQQTIDDKEIRKSTTSSQNVNNSSQAINPPAIISNKSESIKIDSDPAAKNKAKDPIVVGKWGFLELGNGFECKNSPNPFDFDNDSFKEHMCYWYHPETTILFVDFNGNKKLDNGYELLNSKGYDTALDILIESPELCTVTDCYLWQDKNSDILVNDNELEQYSEKFTFSKIIPIKSEGKLITDLDKIFPREKLKDDPRGFFIYGEAEEEILGKLYATKPTYWMKGTK